MPKVVVNGQDYATPPSPATWSALLATLERDLELRGYLVTAVRIDGADLPSFREPPALARALDPHAIVEVEANTPAELLEDGLREASRSVHALATAAVALAAGYRQIDVTEANTHLATFADTLANLMALIAAAGQALRVDLDTLRVGEGPASAIVRQLNTIIEGLVEAHGARDWVTLADLLEHDLAPAMPRVGLVISALGPASTR